LKSAELLEQRCLLAGDPLADWKFDSTSGTVLVDSQNDFDGVLTGAPTWATSGGTRGGALRLYSDSDGATVAAASAPTVQSVALWFKADTTRPVTHGTNTATRMVLFDAGDTTRGVNIYIYNNQLYVGAWNNGVASWSTGTFVSTNLIRAGRWHHVTLTLEPSATLTAGGLKAYLDGVQFGTGNGATVGVAAAIGLGRVDGTTRFHDGTGGANRGFAGFLDEARVYGETLTSTDVADIRAATAPLVPEQEWLVRESGRVADLAAFRFPNVLESEHFVIKWGNNNTSGISVNPTMVQQNLNRLEQSWDIIVEQGGMAPPALRNEGTAAPVKYKVNFYVLETGLWASTGGGAFAGPDAEDFGAMYVSPWGMGGGTTSGTPWGTVVNTTVTPHEFTHVLQYESNGFRNSDFSGPFWETHANYGASLVSNVVTRNSINGRYGQRRHRYASATDFRYEAHPFLNYLTAQAEYGSEFVTGALWSDVDAEGNNKDPWQVLRNNFASYEEFASVYAEYVASSVSYKALHGGALLTGSPSIPAHNTTQRLFRTFLEPVASSPGWWQVPEQDTPEQYGANIIKLTPVGRTAGQPHTITVNLDGYAVLGQANGVYATLVAVSGSGASTQERFSPTWQSGEMTFDLTAAETDVYLAVTAIPSVHRNYIWSHPLHGSGSLGKIERFPYRVAMTGAVPVRSEELAPRPSPGGGAVRHTNPDGSLGGWKTVSVPTTVYIGPNAWVTGGTVSANARIEDYATVTGGTVSGSAIVRGNARVQGGTVTGGAIVDDYAVIVGGTVSEQARVRGDARVENGQIRGNALLLDYATIVNSATVVAGTTVIKGYGVVDNAQMNGNAMVMSSGLAAGTGLVTNVGVQYNGEPSSQETPLMTTQYNNLFARYEFATPDNTAVWDTFNTTYGWVSPTPPAWQFNSGDGFTGTLQFTSDEQFIELSPELSDLGDYTFATWVKWSGEGDANQRIWEFAGDANNYMYLQPTSANGGARFVIAVNGVERVLQAEQSLPANAWSHVAVAFNDQTATLFVDASAKAVRTDVYYDPHQVRAAYGLLGKGSAAGGFRGTVDSFRVYSKGLSAAEVIGLVQLVRPGYAPEPGIAPTETDSEAILVLPFAVHDATGQLVLHGEPVTNGDLRNAAAAARKPAESASPGGMVSGGAQYFTYDAAAEGIAGRPGADGFGMSTVSGPASFADAGSPLELALRTNDTFATVLRARRASDSGGYRFMAGRASAADMQGAWSLAINAENRIVASMGGVDYDTGVTWEVGAWHEVGLSYDGTGVADGTVRVYVDGSRVGEFQPGAIDETTVLNLGIGTGGASRFRGYYDHVEFWDEPVDDATFAAFSGLPVTTLPGDYDGNGAVDGADFLTWQRGIGLSAAPAGSGADGNGNGMIDDYDLGVWKANFGRMPDAGGGTTRALVALNNSPGAFKGDNSPLVGIAQTVASSLVPSAIATVATAPRTAPVMAVDVVLTTSRETLPPARRGGYHAGEFDPLAETELAADPVSDDAAFAAAFEAVVVGHSLWP
jgi:carbonic anhydrase/acetyltransferase-like protein (isoleucine patch superfamily)